MAVEPLQFVEMSPLLRLVLHALRALLAFYSRDYDQLNLDGLYGLRVVEGQTQVIARLTDHTALQDELLDMAQNASVIAERAAVHVRAYEPDYFDRLQRFINRPWSVTGPQRRLDGAMLWAEVIDEEFEEDFSDDCMVELVECRNVSSICLQTMLSRHTSGYSLQHQILYILNAKHTNCLAPLEAYVASFSKTIDDLELEMCSNSADQMLDLETRLTTRLEQDLYLEMAFMCGHIGFVNILSEKGLRHILSWQQPGGCFGETPAVRPLARKLFREKYMSVGCLAHKSAVGAAALTAYLRFLVEPNSVFDVIRVEPVFTGIDYFLIFMCLFMCASMMFYCYYRLVLRRKAIAWFPKPVLG